MQTKQLEDILDAYPYFQAARALHLRGLKNLNSFKYNNALKVTAAYTADRDTLFDFITSEEFQKENNADFTQEETPPSANTPVLSDKDTIVEEEKKFIIEDSTDSPLPRNKVEADHLLDPQLFESKQAETGKDVSEKKDAPQKDLQLGSPLPFTRREKYSFTEWLRLTSLKASDEPINKEQEVGTDPISFPMEEAVLKRKKFHLIDKFIEDNPKIVPKKTTASNIDIRTSVKIDKTELMTETLAKVYLEQKKYKKAVQAYKILSLKYPEKSSFFAGQIEAIHQLQKKNTRDKK